ncbi:30S ribosomal protein S20 [Bosea sp. (in: a-proteobacteria)]|uniref:30S ribosomal protein S20 n=1 Tax=Bosea sp. (in: a-proteobacteria) TaxID=1871050 RepID=UPI0031FE911C
MGIDAEPRSLRNLDNPIARIDRAAAKGVIHKNTAARKKSRLIKQLQSAQA